MKSAVVKVPGALLLDRDLAQSAKLLWVARQLAASMGQDEARSGLLSSLSGLSRHTVLDGLARLAAAGWTPANSPHRRPGAHVSLPDDLLLDPRPGVQAKLLYGTLQLLPGFDHPNGQFTYATLTNLTGVSPNTLTGAVTELAETGWIEVTRKNKVSPLHFLLCNPMEAHRQGQVALAAKRLEESDYVGEAIMREYLSLIVASDEFEDNASPGFLVNPFTGEEMQYDRYYPPHVALEFNGPQHYAPTTRFPSPTRVRKQQARDYIKAGISHDRGITLVVIHAEDLTVARLQQKVAGLLPLRDLHGHRSLAAYLESVSRGYRRQAHLTDHPTAGPGTSDA